MNTSTRDHVHAALDATARMAGDPHVDLADVLAQGSRRRRRSRGFAVAGAALATAAVVGALSIAPQWGGGDEERNLAATGAAPPTEFAYATSTAVHIGDEKIAVDFVPELLLRVDSGMVAVTQDGAWLVSPGKDPAPLTTSGADVTTGTLAGYGDGERAAWAVATAETTTVHVVEATAPGLPKVSFELPTGALERDEEPSLVVTLDGSRVYVQNNAGIHTFDVEDDETEPRLLAPADADLELLDANDGVLVWNDLSDDTVWFGPSFDRGTALGAAHGSATLSPDSRYFLSETNDVGVVTEVATGRALTIANPQYDFQVGYEWSDDDTFFGLAYVFPEDDSHEEFGNPEIFRCDVPATGTDLDCTELPGIGAGETMVTMPFNG